MPAATAIILFSALKSQTSNNTTKEIIMEATIRKYWLAEDKQSSVGSWDIETPDEAIWRELIDQGFDAIGVQTTGSIEIGEWQD